MKRLVGGVGAAFLIALLGATHCSSITEVFVVVDTDLDNTRADEIVVEVKGDTGTPIRKSARLSDIKLPVTLGVEAGGDESGLLVVTATAQKDGKPVVATTVRTRFVQGESRELPVILCSSCAGVQCASGKRCAERARCVSDTIVSSALVSRGSISRLDCNAVVDQDAGAEDGSVADADGSIIPEKDGEPIDTGTDVVVKPDVTALGCGVAGNGLVSHWKMDEGNGTTVADCSATPTNGTLQGTYQWITGRIGAGALQFNDSGYVDLGANTLALGGAISIAAWVKVDSFMGNGRIITKSGPPNQRGWDFNVEGTGVATLQIALTANTQDAAEAPVTTGVWTHLVGVFEPSTSIRMYVNGQLKATTPTTATASVSSQPAFIAQRTDCCKWRGALDDIRIYSRVLTAKEISDLAAQ